MMPISFGTADCVGAALNDQIGAEIAERHGREIGKGAAEHVEHHDQRRPPARRPPINSAVRFQR